MSDTGALRLFLEGGAEIRGIRNLHAKLYLFGNSRVIVTSANLTEAALARNHELGFRSDDAGIIQRCRAYFDLLWERAGKSLDPGRLANWEARISAVNQSGARRTVAAGLTDEGVQVGFEPLPPEPPRIIEPGAQAFVKFFGEGHSRATRDLPVIEEVNRSGSHWACTYPRDRRPTGKEDGAVMFLARLVREPNDIVVYGRATALAHVKGRDDATPADIERRTWKERWPHYIRIHHAEFVAGTLQNGISLNAMMSALAAQSFASTKRNSAAGEGNMNPRKAIRQQADVKLSEEGFHWLNARLAQAFATHGRLASAELETLEWPEMP